MATQAGIGVLIGLGIGSGITAFLMKRIIRRQDNALQQSLNRLNRIQEDHSQDLTAALAKLETDYEQQLAAIIERYQDSQEGQLIELEAEYEARIAALLGANALASDQEVDTSPSSQAPSTPGATTVIEPTSAEGSVPPELSQQSTDDSLRSIPDPWTEAASNSATVIPTPVAEPSPETEVDTVVPTPVDKPSPGTQVDAATVTTVAAVATVATVATAASVDTDTTKATEPETTAPEATAPEATAPTIKKASQVNDPTQIAAGLGKAAAINRKDAIRAIPQLGKLVKDNDPEVRLAAVTALQESGSIKAIPFLRRALRDTDSRIVATASAALSRFKGSKKPAPKAKVTKKKRRR